MSFISLEFVLLFLLCFTSYHFISDKGRKLVLLAASGVFIGYFNPAFLVTALVVSLFTYGAAILIEQAREKGRGFRLIYWGGISCCPLLDWFQVCQPANRRLRFYFPIGNVFLYIPGHRLLDGSLLGGGKGGTPSDRFPALYASVHEVLVRSH